MQLSYSSVLSCLLLYTLVLLSATNGEQLIIVNNCNESLWPGILGGAGQSTPKDGGFHLGSGEEVVLDLPQKWSGRLWARQGCSFDESGRGSCDTGDCSGLLHCQGTGGEPPATVVEMTLGSPTSPLHFYDVSLVDGFNVPVSMAPVGGGIGCGVASCDVDVNICCPSALEVRRNGKIVGCKSACLAMQSAKYCCTGEYANPKTCKPTLFANLFKAICPKAYSYAFDDSSSLNKCRASRIDLGIYIAFKEYASCIMSDKQNEIRVAGDRDTNEKIQLPEMVSNQICLRKSNRNDIHSPIKHMVTTV
ncbi:hypothetical protein Tsubulata_028904 [Turnera subulata]|uniref:Thaumatin-like protein n=1 Tax=Turnera subulata TaxID=218843 RepID=A0A9Q0JPD4_9ROSI|nr:hypothetical protein Tsubulata_028904 [Turnera subulata]